MTNSKHFTPVVICIAALLIALFCISPPLFLHPVTFFTDGRPLGDKLNLKPGIDMVGGTSLLYEIKPPTDSSGKPAAADPDLANKVMEALKKRVDPDGVRNLIWRPQGATRLEIQMPLSGKNQDTGKKRADYAAAQTAVDATNVRPQAVLDAVEKLTAADRDEKLTALAMGDAKRTQLFRDLATTYDQLKAARAKQDAAAEAEAGIKYDDLKAQVAATNLAVPDLEDRLSDVLKYNDPTERQKKFDEINTQLAADFPARLDALKKFEAAYEDYNAVKGSLDDAADLKRLLKGSGVLEYHIVEDDPQVILEMKQRTSPLPQAGDTSRWYRVDRPDEFVGNPASKQFNGKLYLLLSLKPERSLTPHTGARWSLQSAYPTKDNNGETVVGFTFDAQGAKYFGDLTGQNINHPMAIVLDEKVISAPNIRSQITGSGIISGPRGGYSPDELRYLVSTLNAGSLPASLQDEPISERTVGPSVGADNLRAGLMSCGFGLVVVAVFLIGYYYLSGLVAFFAVFMNVVLILGILAMLNATFTLPAVAGIVLTIGTAVDANVLVFERLREEEERGLGLKLALRNAYDRAFSAILDSNMTTAITAIVLYWIGSEEIKGFGLTLLIGICCSLFTALYVTRTIFNLFIDKGHITKLGSLPLSVPAWDRLLKPSINWMNLIWPFIGFSAVFILLGCGFFAHYLHKGEVFDIEFASGTAVQFQLKNPTPIETIRADLHTADPKEEILPSPGIVAVGNDGTEYEIVTPNPDAPKVRDLIIKTFQSDLKMEVPSHFVAEDAPVAAAISQKVVVPVTEKMDGVPFTPANVDNFRGGVAVYLKNLDPKLKPSEIKARLDRQKLQPTPGSEDQSARDYTVVSPTGNDDPTDSAVVLSLDPNIPYDKDADKWQLELATPTWKLINDAVNKPAQLQKVSNFDAQVARDTQTDAIMALALSILIICAYIWVRFANFKFGAANVVALLHDTVFIFAALGFSHAIGGSKLADLLFIEPFRINLTLVAGILTIMGYSMVDTIVVFDRIREIRGKFGHLSRRVINDAINQTLSRTLLTCSTTIVTVGVMYVFGGPGIHGFTFVLLVGILVGTYSSIAIASPLLLIGNDVDRTDVGVSQYHFPEPQQLQKV